MTFLAQSLPPSVPADEPVMLGNDLRAVPATGALVGRLCAHLRERSSQLRERPVAEVVEALGVTGERFLDGADPVRAEALERLPETTGLSAPMTRAVLDGMAADWTRPRLEEWLRRELGDPACLDGLVHGDDRSLMAIGPRLCTQIVSGSVPGVGVGALLQSLLVKAPTLLKPGLGDVVLPVLFARALAQTDPALAEALAVLYWRGGTDDVERAAMRSAEVVVAYGSDPTVAELRAGAPPTARFLAHHHRTSVAVVGRGVLTRERSTRAAEVVARAVALFDQRGCVCPHDVFVERGGAVTPETMAREIAHALDGLEGEWPGGPLDLDEAAAVQQLRGYGELAEADGSAELHHGAGRASWTVVLDRGSRPAPPTGGRGVRVRPIDRIEDVADALRGMGDHLQTVGYVGLGERAGPLGLALGRIGASRVVPLHTVSFPPPWWVHDGRGTLSELVRWVELVPES